MVIKVQNHDYQQQVQNHGYQQQCMKLPLTVQTP